jgi:ribosomal protein L11 methyltransferase
MSSTRVWRRLIPARLAEEWQERLLWAGPEKTVWHELPSGKSTRVEIYDLSEQEAEKLKRHFGGEIRQLKSRQWIHAQERQFCLPIPPHLCLLAPGVEPPQEHRHLPRLTIPASIAFGTGEHPTTRLCLRHALRLAGDPPQSIADLGTGSGVLALALSLKGHQLEAIDFDPDCIREARANADRNPHVPEVDWAVLPVEEWKPKRKFDLIVANLFAEILVQGMGTIRRSLKPSGKVVLSGILREKEALVTEALEACGLRKLQRLRVGKWIALIASSKSAL